nr:MULTISPECIES: CAP domain-containing protein [unclassified Lysinibacillus]
MKKSFITFCAFALLATQAPAANAAATTGGESDVRYEKSYKSVQTYKFNSIVLNQNINIWDSISNFIEFKHAIPVKGNVSVKVTEVKKPVTTQTEEKAPVSQTAPKQPTTKVEKAPVVTKEQPKTPVKQVTPEQPKAPTTEVKTEQPKAPTNEVKTEQPKAPTTEVKTEQPKATETKTQPNTSQNTKPSTTPVTSTSSDIDAIEAAVVELTNAERVKAGLQPLKTYAPLMASAREKSQDMKDKNYFSHTSPTYGSPFDQMKARGISYTAAGENIAKGQRTAEEVVTAWMNSEGHRANILNANFTHIGVGYVKDGNIWTQQFIKQ